MGQIRWHFHWPDDDIQHYAAWINGYKCKVHDTMGERGNDSDKWCWDMYTGDGIVTGLDDLPSGRTGWWSASSREAAQEAVTAAAMRLPPGPGKDAGSLPLPESPAAGITA